MGTKQERVSEFGDRSKGIIQYKQPKEKKKSWAEPQNPWVTDKRSNIHVPGVRKEGE